MTSHHTLWIGDLETWMDYKFIRDAFEAMGEQVVNIKIIRNKMTGEPLNYGFVSFEDEDTMNRVLISCTGKQIPNAPAGKRFKLNKSGKQSEGNEEYSIFVGDLSQEVDDLTLFNAFLQRYSSTREAKVIMDGVGASRGFGFVKLTDEPQFRAALRECQNVRFVGTKPIRVSVALPRKKHNHTDYTASSTISSTSATQSFGNPNMLTSNHENNESSEIDFQSTYPDYYAYQQQQAFGYPESALYYQYPSHFYGANYYPQVPYAPLRCYTYGDEVDVQKENNEAIARETDLHSSIAAARWD